MILAVANTVVLLIVKWVFSLTSNGSVFEYAWVWATELIKLTFIQTDPKARQPFGHAALKLT